MSHEVVSSEDELLILVDGQDQAIGTLSKAACHDGSGVLHRAFSVFLLDQDNRLLVQQRAASKRLWPMFWANSCCSHPRAGETLAVATSRRIKEELGLSSALYFAYRFEYQASFHGLGAEHELCSVYLGRADPAELDPNPNEIAATNWLTLSEVDELMASADVDESVAPWFQLEWQRFRGDYAPLLNEFLERSAIPQ